MKAIILNELKQVVFETSIDIVLPNIEVKQALIKSLGFIKDNELIIPMKYENIIYVPKHIIYEKKIQ